MFLCFIQQNVYFKSDEAAGWISWLGVGLTIIHEVLTVEDVYSSLTFLMD